MSTPDLRMVFLERAAARLRLVKSCDMELVEAIGGLVPAFEEIVGWGMASHCTREMVKRWEAADDGSRRRRHIQKGRAA